MFIKGGYWLLLSKALIGLAHLVVPTTVVDAATCFVVSGCVETSCLCTFTCSD